MLNPQNDFEPDFDVEKACYRRLKSVPYSLPPAEFNWELAAFGYYSKMQKERSDIALDEFEKELDQMANWQLEESYDNMISKGLVEKVKDKEGRTIGLVGFNK